METMKIMNALVIACLKASICSATWNQEVQAIPRPLTPEEEMSFKNRLKGLSDISVEGEIIRVIQSFSHRHDGIDHGETTIKLRTTSPQGLHDEITINTEGGPISRYCWRDYNKLEPGNRLEKKLSCRYGILSVRPGPAYQERPSTGMVIQAWLKNEEAGYRPVSPTWWYSSVERLDKQSTNNNGFRMSQFDLSFEGLVTEIKYGCIADATCSIMVDGITVMISEGLGGLALEREGIEHGSEIDSISSFRKGTLSSINCGASLRADNGRTEDANREISNDHRALRPLGIDCSLYGSKEYFAKSISDFTENLNNPRLHKSLGGQ